MENSEQNHHYLDSFPPGYRFCPTEGELVFYYLKRKVEGSNLPPNNMIDVDIYQYNPHCLAERFRAGGENQWYFFSSRNKKYKNGNRPNRAAGDGYWKATGADKAVLYNGEVVGAKKALAFFIGKPPAGRKTNWLMHEFTALAAPAPIRHHENDMKLDDWVLCKIYYKGRSTALRFENGSNEDQVLNQNNEGADQPEAEELVDTDNPLIDIGHSGAQYNNVLPITFYQEPQQQYQNSIVSQNNTNFGSHGANTVDASCALNAHLDYEDDWYILNDPDPHPDDENM